MYADICMYVSTQIWVLENRFPKWWAENPDAGKARLPAEATEAGGLSTKPEGPVTQILLLLEVGDPFCVGVLTVRTLLSNVHMRTSD